MSKKVKYVLVGTGARSSMYLETLAGNYREYGRILRPALPPVEKNAHYKFA